jgi:hypothetical protein
MQADLVREEDEIHSPICGIAEIALTESTQNSASPFTKFSVQPSRSLTLDPTTTSTEVDIEIAVVAA